MQRESVNQKRGVSARNWIVWLAVLIAAPATLLVAWRFGNRKYYLSSMLLIVYAMLPFFVRFEHKKPQARGARDDRGHGVRWPSSHVRPLSWYRSLSRSPVS